MNWGKTLKTIGGIALAGMAVTVLGPFVVATVEAAEKDLPPGIVPKADPKTFMVLPRKISLFT